MTDILAEWMSRSVCRSVDDRPEVFYHSTAAGTVIDAFRPMSHFGSAGAAAKRASNMGKADAVTYAVHLNITQPLRMIDSGRDSQFAIPDIVESLPESFWEDLSSDEMDILMEGDDDEATTLFVDYVSGFGYDGVVYENVIEGGMSYCVFRPDQVWIEGAAAPMAEPVPEDTFAP